jgi:hypothetical protein
VLPPTSRLRVGHGWREWSTWGGPRHAISGPLSKSVEAKLSLLHTADEPYTLHPAPLELSETPHSNPTALQSTPLTRNPKTEALMDPPTLFEVLPSRCYVPPQPWYSGGFLNPEP